jgi:hypothetical protein
VKVVRRCSTGCCAGTCPASAVHRSRACRSLMRATWRACGMNCTSHLPGLRRRCLPGRSGSARAGRLSRRSCGRAGARGCGLPGVDCQDAVRAYSCTARQYPPISLRRSTAAQPDHVAETAISAQAASCLLARRRCPGVPSDVSGQTNRLPPAITRKRASDMQGSAPTRSLDYRLPTIPCDDARSCAASWRQLSRGSRCSSPRHSFPPRSSRASGRV